MAGMGQPFAYTSIFTCGSDYCRVCVSNFTSSQIGNQLVCHFAFLHVVYTFVKKNLSRPLMSSDGQTIFNTSRDEQYFHARPEWLAAFTNRR